MSMSDDPRGFRRGQGGSRDYPPRQAPSGAPGGDRYDGYRQSEPSASRPPRNQPEKQPSFSAFRPEAYAKNEPGGASGHPERSDWEAAQRNAPPRAAPPPADPYARTPPPPPPPQDPYYQNASSDPYAPRSSRGYAPDWDRESFQESGASPFPSYYPPDEPAASDAQSVHDRFFAPEEVPDDAPPAGHYRGAFEDHNFEPGPPQGFDPEPPQRFSGPQMEPYSSEQAPLHGDAGNFDSNFEDNGFYNWDQPDQAPPPQSVRPIYPPPADEDLDADFFADEDDYDLDEYEDDHRGGRKKLVAVVLIGAVAVGGGLAYFYKSSIGGGEGPSLITADSTPIKEEPADPGGREFPNRNKVIYDRLIDDESSSTQETASAEPASSGGNIPGIVTTGTLEQRIENALKAQGNETQTNASAPAAKQAESPDAPRTVRTVTFSPDGTQQAVQPDTQRIAVASAQNNPVSSGVVVTSQPATIESSQSEGAEQTGAAERSQASGTQQIAAVSPQSQSPQVTASPSATGSYFVQIAARNDQEAAVAAFATLQQKYASVIGNYSPSVRKVDLGAKGVWYRLLVGPVETKSEADALCEQLKGAGMKSCFSRKN